MKLGRLCKLLTDNRLSARLDGDDIDVTAVNTLDLAGDGDISFLSNPKYLSALKTTKASAVIVGEDVEVRASISSIRCSDPYAALAIAIVGIHGYRKHPQWGVSERATIHPSARIGEDANIAENVVIGADVRIAEKCTIYPGCYIADRVRIGHECVLFPNVVIYDDSVLGDRVTVHAGSVIGQDGLGYAPVGDSWLKIPQVGRAVIGADVEIGANCAIDRATLGETSVGPGTKFGNVIVIGHGAKVGPECMFVGLVGVAGSAMIGRHVTLAGQVGVLGHISVGDGVTAGGQTGIMGDVAKGEKVFGTPAVSIDKARRAAVSLPKLPDLIKRVRELESEVASLRKQAEE